MELRSGIVEANVRALAWVKETLVEGRDAWTEALANARYERVEDSLDRIRILTLSNRSEQRWDCDDTGDAFKFDIDDDHVLLRYRHEVSGVDAYNEFYLKADRIKDKKVGRRFANISA